MKVLVVGGAGYLGGALTDILPMHDVRVYDALLYEEAYRKDPDFVFGDVRDRAKLGQHLAWADAVVWLAGIVGDGACALNPAMATEVNYDALEWLAGHFDRRIINMSTCSVYGARDEVLSETSPTNPLSLYASIKLKTEVLLADKNAISFRLGTLFGLGDNYSRIRLDLVVNTLTAKAVSEHRLRVFGGEQWRPLLHVRDAAHAIADNLSTTHTGVFNLHGVNTKIIDIARAVQEAVPNTALDVIGTSFEDARNYSATSKKATDTFGFAPSSNIFTGIYEMKKLLLSGRIKNLNNPRYTNQGFLSGTTTS